MAALVPGVCKKVTKSNVFKANSGVSSVTHNSFSPLEAGVTMDADGLAKQVAVNCS